MVIYKAIAFIKNAKRMNHIVQYANTDYTKKVAPIDNGLDSSEKATITKINWIRLYYSWININ